MSETDFHLHSSYSDGSDNVAELYKNIEKAKLTAFALTDHDTFDGCLEMQKYVKDICFIKGIELTCTLKDIRCHLLGYDIDLQSKELAELVEKGKVLRRRKLDTRIEYLKNEWNIILSEDEKNWLYSRKSVVKTHLANLLVKRGLADDNVSAMKKYLDACKTGNTRFDGEEAISVLKKTNGIIVWAHPLGGEGEEHLTEEQFLPQLQIMKQHGIQGLECFYSRYSEAECYFLYKTAIENNLLVSGGSDYHGRNKNNISIGQLNTDNVSVNVEKITLLKYLQQNRSIL